MFVVLQCCASFIQSIKGGSQITSSNSPRNRASSLLSGGDGCRDMKEGKVIPLQARPGAAQRVGRGIALLFHDRGTRRSEWSAACPGRILPPGKTRYPFNRRLGGPQGQSGRAENLIPTRSQSQTVQPIVSHYTDSATWPTPTVSTDRKITINDTKKAT